MEAKHTAVIVSAKDFHPMRGHVAPNTRVDFANGATLFVQPDGLGWCLCNAFGDRASERGLDAHALTRAIVEIDAKATQ